MWGGWGGEVAPLGTLGVLGVCKTLCEFALAGLYGVPITCHDMP